MPVSHMRYPLVDQLELPDQYELHLPVVELNFALYI